MPAAQFKLPHYAVLPYRICTAVHRREDILMETLSKNLINSGHVFPADVKVAPLTDYPVRILQFGEGNFLRCFVDCMGQKINDHCLFYVKTVVVFPIHF